MNFCEAHLAPAHSFRYTASMGAKRKKLILAALLAFGLLAAFQAITHSDFYAELERLNMDNHQH
jgi:hypothetical protein